MDAIYSNLYYFSKAIHIIGFVAWFAGLFYLVRMFVYHVEAKDLTQPSSGILQKQFSRMEWRVYKIICNPAMMITWTFGIVMLVLGILRPELPNYLTDLEMIRSGSGWMHAKLLLIVLLTAYHLWCKRIAKQLEAGKIPFTDFQFRLLNEVPTLFLVVISFLAVFGIRGNLNYVYLAIGMLIFIGLLYWGALAYKKRRMKMASSE